MAVETTRFTKNSCSMKALIAALVVAIGCSVCLDVRAQTGEPVPLIFDTDLGPDSDDAGAMALMHALASLGETEILAVMCGTRSPWCAPAADVINTYYGRPDIPIGTLKRVGPAGTSEEWPGDAFNGFLAGRFENDLQHAEHAEDALSLYRKILASAPDSSVVVAVTGSLTNPAHLLRSPADDIDPRSGAELVGAKVRRLSVMGGRYPDGTESNFMVDADAARFVAADWPTPIMFSGFELGMDVLTGPRLYTETPPENPVRTAYELWDLVFARRFDPDFDPSTGIWPHSSFDQTAVLYAVRGLRDYWTAETRGYNVVNEDGSNAWRAPPETTSAVGSEVRPAGEHAYLLERMSREELASVIEELMVRAPTD